MRSELNKPFVDFCCVLSLFLSLPLSLSLSLSFFLRLWLLSSISFVKKRLSPPVPFVLCVTPLKRRWIGLIDCENGSLPDTPVIQQNDADVLTWIRCFAFRLLLEGAAFISSKSSCARCWWRNAFQCSTKKQQWFGVEVSLRSPRGLSFSRKQPHYCSLEVL